MGLFVKRQNAGEHAALYTMSANRSVLIVGLGNIGKQYQDTRHNLGFDCLEYYAKTHDFPLWHEKKDLSCQITSQTVGASRVILIKPTTFMNMSGNAVNRVCQFFKLSAQNILVVHDELDIDFGQIKTKMGGGTAGHNGLKSIAEQIGQDFARIRIGIGRPKNAAQDTSDFVLSKFDPVESQHLTSLKKEVTSLIDGFAANSDFVSDSRQFLV